MESAVQVDSNLRLQVVVYATTSVSVNVSYRERVNGNVRQPRQTNIAAARITTAGAANYFYFTFAGNASEISELLNVTIGLATASVQRGQCFVRVGITVGGTDGAATDPIQILFSDYVTSNSFLGYPGTGIKSSLEGKGYIFPYQSSGGTGSTTINLGLNRLSNIFSLVFSFQSSASVANRKPFVYINMFNSTYSNYILMSTGITIPASSTKTFLYQIQPFEIRNDSLDGMDYVLNFLPGNCFIDSTNAAQGSIYISATDIEADDIISDISISIEQWIKA